MSTEAVQATMQKTDTWALRGMVVTMNDKYEIIKDGLVIISGGKIKDVVHADQLPDDLKGIEIMMAGGIIYPGLMDLHNHLAYNVMPLWAVPKTYKSRDQWRAYPNYKSDVYQPVAEVLSVKTKAARASARFIEAKALMGGVSTGQGIGKRTKQGDALLKGAMRNVEMPLADYLPAAGGTVMDIHMQPGDIEDFRKRLKNPDLKAYLYHLAEGVDNVSRQYYLNLRDNDLINEKLVGIHCLGLLEEDLQYLAAKHAKVVWSPYSNLLLYGQTLDLKLIKKTGVLFSIGCDWSPSGSKNLLEEVKIAWQVNEDQGQPFTEQEIVAALTCNPAKILGWDKFLGTIAKDKLADLLVLENMHTNVYQNLIAGIEKNIQLVLIDGIARFGNPDLMKKFPVEAGATMETIKCGTTEKLLYLYHPESEINDLSFQQAKSDLTIIMNDLKAYVDESDKLESKMVKGDFAPAHHQFELLIDEDMAPIETTEKLLIAPPPRKNSIPLDETFPDETNYLKAVEAQINLPLSIKSILRKSYGA